MSRIERVCLLAAWFMFIGCGPLERIRHPGDASEDGGSGGSPEACAKEGKPPTTISGTVFAPNGTLPLQGVTVYVPLGTPPPLPDGVQCTRCADSPPGALTLTTSDELGHFTLPVPAGRNVPLVIQIGKWRRLTEVSEVIACSDNQVLPEQTSLPKNRTEGDLPRIAIVTGLCDALECLIRKLGVDASEFTPDTGPGSIHLFASNGTDMLADTTPLSRATTLWGSVDKLKQYDIAMLSCECGQHAEEKPQATMDAIKAYADLGGRLYLSHWQNVWLSGEVGVPAHAPAIWPAIASCDGLAPGTTGDVIIDQVNSPKGKPFARWMVNVAASSKLGIFPVSETKGSCARVDAAKAERWVYVPSSPAEPVETPVNFQFSTPNEVVKEKRCGKVVFSDMHVSIDSSSAAGTRFPAGCSMLSLTPQEKALAFMFFDLSACVEPPIF